MHTIHTPRRRCRPQFLENSAKSVVNKNLSQKQFKTVAFEANAFDVLASFRCRLSRELKIAKLLRTKLGRWRNKSIARKDYVSKPLNSTNKTLVFGKRLGRNDDWNSTIPDSCQIRNDSDGWCYHGRHPKSKAKLRNTKRLHAPLTDNPHKNKKIESKWNVRKWLKSSHFIRRNATKKALRRKREKLRRKSCKMMMKNKTRTLCLLLMLFILRHLTSQGVEILSFSAFVFAGIQRQRMYILHHPCEKGSPAENGMFTHIWLWWIMIIFFMVKEFFISCAGWKSHTRRVTAWTEGERQGGREKRRIPNLFIYVWLEWKLNFLGYIKIIYYNP